MTFPTLVGFKAGAGGGDFLPAARLLILSLLGLLIIGRFSVLISSCCGLLILSFRSLLLLRCCSLFLISICSLPFLGRPGRALLVGLPEAGFFTPLFVDALFSALSLFTRYFSRCFWCRGRSPGLFLRLLLPILYKASRGRLVRGVFVGLAPLRLSPSARLQWFCRQWWAGGSRLRSRSRLASGDSPRAVPSFVMVGQCPSVVSDKSSSGSSNCWSARKKASEGSDTRACECLALDYGREAKCLATKRKYMKDDVGSVCPSWCQSLFVCSP